MNQSSRYKPGSGEPTCSIVFKDGSESRKFTSKKDLLRSLENLAQESKLTSDECDDIADEAMKDDNLPPLGPGESESDFAGFFGSGSFFDAFFGGAANFGPMVIIQLSVPDTVSPKTLMEMFPEIDALTNVDVPIFRMHPDGTFGVILFSFDGKVVHYSERIYTKYDGLKAVQTYKKRKALTQDADDSITKQVDESPLPETKREKAAQ